MLRKFKDYAAAILLAGSALAVMLLPEATGRGISDGITLCLNRVVPSVFPMMLICVMAVECGFAQKAGRRLAPLSSKLFRLPGEAAAAVLLSVTGGYPAGAKTVAELYESGEVTRRQASRMMLFCFCSGPAFLIGMVGGLTGSAWAGWLLMGVQAVVVVLLGVAAGRIKDGAEDNSCRVSEGAGCQCGRSMSEAVVVSVSKSAAAVLQVCLYVIIFSAVSGVLGSIGAGAAAERLLVRLGFDERLAGAVLPSLLEVTGGCIRSAEAGLPMMAFAVGFGGLSVHLQVLAIAGKLGVNRLHFLAARIVQGLLSAAITAGVLRLLPDGAVVPASAQLDSFGLSGSPQGALVLVVMCAVCVLCLPDGNSSLHHERTR